MLLRRDTRRCPMLEDQIGLRDLPRSFGAFDLPPMPGERPVHPNGLHPTWFLLTLATVTTGFRPPRGSAPVWPTASVMRPANSMSLVRNSFPLRY